MVAEKQKSFQEFYYKKTGAMVGVETVANYALTHEDSTVIYDGQMLCPECEMAGLYFVNKTHLRKAHLRRLPSERHMDGCSYNYPRASKRTIQKHFDSLSKEQVQDKLDAVMRMLFKLPAKVDGMPQICDRKTLVNPMLLKACKRNKEVIESLRRKRLDAWMEETDTDEIFVFYGKVKLKSVQKEKVNTTTKYNVLEVYNVAKDGKEQFRTSLFRGTIKDCINEDSFYNIVIIGKVGNKGWQIEMLSIHALKYREIR